MADAKTDLPDAMSFILLCCHAGHVILRPSFRNVNGTFRLRPYEAMRVPGLTTGICSTVRKLGSADVHCDGARFAFKVVSESVFVFSP